MTDVLLRQVNTKIDADGQAADEKKNLASFSDMCQFGTGNERCMLILGYLFAVFSGAILPIFIFMLGPVFDSFGAGADPEETLDQIVRITYIMAGLAVIIMITAYF
jgi:hypothetical protein